MFTKSLSRAVMAQPQRFHPKKIVRFKTWCPQTQILPISDCKGEKTPSWELKWKRKQRRLKIKSNVGFLNSDSLWQHQVSCSSEWWGRGIHLEGLMRGEFYNCLISIREQMECDSLRRECGTPFSHSSNPWVLRHAPLRPTYTQVTHPWERTASEREAHFLTLNPEWLLGMTAPAETSGVRTQSHQTGVLTVESAFVPLVGFQGFLAL